MQANSISRHDADMLEPKHIRYLVVHCSDTPDDDGVTAADIHAMHLGFGWDGAGYHAIITRDGMCHAGRPEYWQGAHVKGRNQDSLGVCLIGRHAFTSAQFAALETLLLDWQGRYPDAEVVGHRDIQDTPKTCPNFDAGQWWQNHNPLAGQTALVMAACAQLYKTPPARDGLLPAPETEALMGEVVEIQSPDQVSGYIEVRLKQDGYKGWMAVTCLCRTPDDINRQKRHKITAAATFVTAAPDVKSAPLASLSMGAIVKVEDEQDSYTKVSLNGRAGMQLAGYLPTHTLGEAVSDIKVPDTDWPVFGEKFLGMPYKWGGRSAAGLDCSALLQLSLSAAGFNVPRDSRPQHAFMKPAAKMPDARFKNYQRGDILFWEGHVGICISKALLLHANAYHANVAIEPIEQAITRIKSYFGAPTEHIDGAQLLQLLSRQPLS